MLVVGVLKVELVLIRFIFWKRREGKERGWNKGDIYTL